jgi:hypothetical protein
MQSVSERIGTLGPHPSVYRVGGATGSDQDQGECLTCKTTKELKELREDYGCTPKRQLEHQVSPFDSVWHKTEE